MKKFYIASRVRDKDVSKSLEASLKQKGYDSVTYWLGRENIQQPLSSNQDYAREIAVEALRAVAECEIFILLSDEGGTGMYVELGAALAKSLTDADMQIFVVGEHDGASSVFTYHPSVILVSDTAKLISIL